MQKYFSTKNIAGIAVFTALSFILYLPIFEIPIFPGTPYKLDFSNVCALLGGFMYGPIGGVVILVIKEALHLLVGSSGGVGELANLILGLSFILPPTIVYRYKKGLKIVIIMLVVSCLLQTVAGIFSNKYILLPFYGAETMFDSWFWFIVGINLIKSSLDSVIVVILYKKLSRFFIKINLKEGKTNQKEIISHSQEETIKIAYNYAKTLKKGDVVLLSGDLGAGKTEFVKGIAQYFNLSGVTSPTYAYLNIYGDKLYHYDCYRLSSGADAEILGLTDYFNKDNICLIEWSENIKEVLPKKTKKVIIEKISETERKIIL